MMGMMLRKSDTLVGDYASDFIHFMSSSKEGRCHDGNTHFDAISICGFDLREMVAILLQHAEAISNLSESLYNSKDIKSPMYRDMVPTQWSTKACLL